MKRSPFLLLCVVLGVITLPQLSGNSGSPEGPPTSQEPSTQDPEPEPDECPQPPCDPPDPVVLSGGKFYYPVEDVEIPGLGRAFEVNLEIFRGYSSQSAFQGLMGYGWTCTLDMALSSPGSASPFFRDKTGAVVYFQQQASMTFADGHTGPGWQISSYTLEAIGQDFQMVDGRGNIYRFDAWGRLLYVEDPLAHRIERIRDGNGRITSLKESGATGRSLTFTYHPTGFLNTVSDPLSRVWTYSYDTAGNLTSVVGPSPLSLTETYAYDSAHNMLSVMNKRGHSTSYEYDTYDRVVKQTHPDSKTIAFSYNNFLGTSSMTDEENYIWQYEYIGQGRLSNVINPIGAVSHYEYNSNHQIVKFWDPLYDPITNPNRVKLYTWTGHMLTQVKNEMQSVRVFSYNSQGELVGETDGNGHTSSVVRDNYRRVTKTTDGRGKETIYTYDATSGLIATQKDRLNRTSTFGYDNYGNLASFTDKDGKVWTQTFDVVGRQKTKTTPAPLSRTVEWTYDVADRMIEFKQGDGKVWVYSYDENGNQTAVTDPLAHTFTRTYDSRDRVIEIKNPQNQATTFAYDGRGKLISETSPLQKVTTRAYDAVGRLVSITEPPATAGGPSVVTSMTYNLANEIETVTEPRSANITTFQWDPVLRKHTKTFPDASTEVSNFDFEKNVISFKNRSGDTISKTYNENNWLIAQNCPTCGATLTYDDEGNLLTAIDANTGTYEWTYDNLGRVLTSTQPGGAAGQKVVTYTYNAIGSVASLKYPDNMTLTYAYDDADRLSQITSPQGNYLIGYDIAGRRNKVTFPGGTYGDFIYDNSNRVTKLEWKSSGGLVLAADEAVLDNGGRAISSATVNGVSGSEIFSYNDNDRLVSRTGTGTLSTHFLNATYSFDLNGNRTSVVTPSSTKTYAMGANLLNQYTSVGGVAFNYDTRGNITSDGVRTMTYDTDNRLTKVVKSGTTVDYKYDFLHRLSSRASGGSTIRYIYDQNWNIIADIDGTGSTVRKYIRGPMEDDLLCQYNATLPLFALKNRMNSTIALVNANTNGVVQRYAYDQYGQVKVLTSSGAASSSSPSSRYLFTGREYDASTQLYHYRHRWYHPELGRFLSPDPIGFAGGDVSLYNYVRSNPLAWVDPLGLVPPQGNSTPTPSGGNQPTTPSTPAAPPPAPNKPDPKPDKPEKGKKQPEPKEPKSDNSGQCIGIIAALLQACGVKADLGNGWSFGPFNSDDGTGGLGFRKEF